MKRCLELTFELTGKQVDFMDSQVLEAQKAFFFNPLIFLFFGRS